MPFAAGRIVARPHRSLRIFVALFAGAAVLVVTVLAASAAARPRRPAQRAGTAVAGSYIVTLNSGADADRVVRGHSIAAAAVSARYHTAFSGFTAQLTSAAAAQLAADPRVASVEPDRWAEVAAVQSPAPWGLDRLDQRSRPVNDAYGYGTTGAGVRVYVLDTGVRRTHVDFGSRVVAGYDATGFGSTADCNGHGTHVAGTIGGARYGVAKSVTIVPVRVMRCDGLGLVSEILLGMDWVAAEHDAGEPAVANLSIATTDPVNAVDVAVSAGVLDGITYVVAAGNADADACNVSPARVPEAITVGASNARDGRAFFSNWGACLDVFAPGTNITSADAFADRGGVTMSGTSMATPHVAGAAARYLQGQPSAAPATVAGAIIGDATTGIITGAGTGSPRRLLYISPTATVNWTTAAAPSPTHLSISRSAARITYGNSVTVAGLLTANGHAVAGERVDVQRRAVNSTTWRVIARRLTSSTGRVSFSDSPAASVRYRLSYGGGAYQASTSDSVGVGVRTRVTAWRSAGVVEPGDVARITGKVAPSHAGRTVLLQRRQDTSWKTIKKPTLSAESRYSVRVPTSRRGVWTFRVVRPSDSNHLTGFSPRRTITVD